jgi:hypothetical protein
MRPIETFVIRFTVLHNGDLQDEELEIRLKNY